MFWLIEGLSILWCDGVEDECVVIVVKQEGCWEEELFVPFYRGNYLKIN